MKIEKSNLQKRLTNVYFWIGLIGVLGTALQVDGATLTSWDSLGKLITSTVSNPYVLFTTIMAIVGVFVNPATKGLTD